MRFRTHRPLIDWRSTLWLDARFAVRSLGRTPGVTAAVVLMLALGIGANAAMYGLLSRLFLQPPPHIQNPEAIHRVYVQQKGGLDGQVFTYAIMDWVEFGALRADRLRYSAVSGHTSPSPTPHGVGQAAEELQVSWVTGDFFPLLGVAPTRGRLIGRDDDVLTAAPAAVISDAYWRRRFDRSDDALGATLRIDEITYTIIGVTPQGFSGPDPSAADVWLPVHHAATGERGENWRRAGSGFGVVPLVRLADGVTTGAAEAAATGGLRAVRQGSSFQDPQATALFGPLLATRGPGRMDSDMQLPLLVGGVALVVLLIATANVANLLMLRGASRRRELAVRAALGAGRWGIGRLVVLESVLLAFVSAVAAVGVALVAGQILRVTLLPDHHWAAGPLDGVLTFTALTALVVALVAALVPAAQAGRATALVDLHAGRRRGSLGRSALRSGFLVVQAALSLVLLAGAFVFYQSFDAARRVDIGYAWKNLLSVTLDGLSFARRTTLDASAVAALEQRLRAQAGVLDVAQGTNSPLNGMMAIPLRVRGMERLPRMNGPYVNFVTPNFFDVADLAIANGRAFNNRDHERAPRVAIVNTTFARTVWPGRNPLDECLFVGFDSTECATVVGVVEAARERGLDEDGATPQYYIPLAQALGSGATARIGTARRTMVVRTGIDPGRLVPPALVMLGELFPDLPRDRVQSLPDLFAPRVRSWKVGMGLFGAAAALALVLAAIGLYAAIAFGVRQREPEFGIRLALGAQTWDVLKLVLVQGVGIAVAGIVAGGLISFWVGTFVGPLLFEERSARDPAALAGAAAVLLAVAAAAALLPARRATRVDPRQALQAE